MEGDLQLNTSRVRSAAVTSGKGVILQLKAAISLFGLLDGEHVGVGGHGAAEEESINIEQTSGVQSRAVEHIGLSGEGAPLLSIGQAENTGGLALVGTLGSPDGINKVSSKHARGINSLT